MRIATARALARRWHGGELDGRGSDRLYLDHLEQVAEQVRAAGGGHTEIAAAYLHGLSKHAGLDAAALPAAGVPPRVVAIVPTLTLHRWGVRAITGVPGPHPV